jgi:ATP-dependent Clp protease adaptor protein ClpS
VYYEFATVIILALKSYFFNKKGELFMSENTIFDSKVKPKLAKPKSYVAVILNDDFTTFQAVEFILQKYFNKNAEDAAIITREVHENGKGIAGGPYSYEVCETKCYEAIDFAKFNQMPLMVVPEEV